MTKGIEMILAPHDVTYLFVKHADVDLAQVKQGRWCNLLWRDMLA